MAVVEVKDDNWLDLKDKGPDGNVGDIGVIDKETTEIVIDQDWATVGNEDLVDYMKFTIDDVANLSFHVTGDDVVTFTIYSLIEKVDKKGIKTYSLKSLQSSSLKKQSDGSFSIDTKGLLLTAGDYYIGVQAAKKVDDFGYTISNNNSKFYDEADDGFDNWLYDKKTKELNDDILIGDFYSEEGVSNWVGFGDAADYYELTNEWSSKVVFDVTSSDALKFTIWSVTTGEDKKGNTTYTVKSLQSTTLKQDKSTLQYTAETKALLLENKENVTYYCSVESTNAAKGGDANYTITLDNDNSKFYDKADDGLDNWLYDSKTKEFNDEVSVYQSIGKDSSLTIDDEFSWVGLGDATDYYGFSVDEYGEVYFNISSTDAIKVSIYQFVDNKLKTLQSTTVKANVAVSTKNLKLNEGTYYIGIESTNAAKGGDALYSITGSFYVAPLNMTIKGIENELFEDLDEFDVDCGCFWGDEEYHYENCIPDAAKYDDIVGTNNNDVITFEANYSRYFNSIDLGNGHDRIIFNDFKGDPENDSELGSEHLRFNHEQRISLGAGDDLIYIGSHSDLNVKIIDFGSGNDTLTINGDLELVSSGDEYEEQYIDMGDGNDKIIGNSFGCIIYSSIRFGEGDDYFEISKDMFVEVDELDFGSGNDTLVLNGTLCAHTLDNVFISGLDKISGTGVIVTSDGIIDDELLTMIKNTKITIVNTLGSSNFSSIDEERGDDTIKGKYVDDIDDVVEGWLCGREVANDVDYGFVDEIDYIKFIITENMDEEFVFIGVNRLDSFDDENYLEDISVKLCNYKGIEIDDLTPIFEEDYYLSDYSLQYDISSLKTGTYYLAISTSSEASYEYYVDWE